MKTWIENRMLRLASAAGAYPTPLTRRADLERLLAALRPWETEAGLIRLGPGGDGGYLVPDDLEGIAACFSPGVSDVSGFEVDCAERGMEVFLADRSVAGPAESHARFHFTPKYVGAIDDAEFMTLGAWVDAALPGSTGDLLLQMDIEGFEWETLFAAPAALLGRFRIIVCEFHRLDLLFSRPYFQVASRAFAKLLKTHVPVHIHPNNCQGSVRRGAIEIPRFLEFTFLRKDRGLGGKPATRFPHPLDADNTTERPLVLPACWYGG